MPRQLIYTSAPAGLVPGRSGFCVVARHGSLPERVVAALERICSYEPIPIAGAPPRPVIFTYRIITTPADAFGVISRYCDAGVDYTNRRNALAHHLVFSRAEMAMLPPPAEIARRWDGWLSAWNAQPRFLDENDTALPEALKIAETAPPAVSWKTITGDGANALLLSPDGVPADSTLDISANTLDCDTLLCLFAESSLFVRAGAWSASFTTQVQLTDNAAPVLWKTAGDADTLATARRVFRLETLGTSADISPRAKLAREGASKPAAVPRPAPPKPPPSKKKPTAAKITGGTVKTTAGITAAGTTAAGAESSMSTVYGGENTGETETTAGTTSRRIPYYIRPPFQSAAGTAGIDDDDGTSAFAALFSKHPVALFFAVILVIAGGFGIFFYATDFFHFGKSQTTIQNDADSEHVPGANPLAKTRLADAPLEIKWSQIPANPKAKQPARWDAKFVNEQFRIFLYKQHKDNGSAGAKPVTEYYFDFSPATASEINTQQPPYPAPAHTIKLIQKSFTQGKELVYKLDAGKSKQSGKPRFKVVLENAAGNLIRLEYYPPAPNTKPEPWEKFITGKSPFRLTLRDNAKDQTNQPHTRASAVFIPIP